MNQTIVNVSLVVRDYSETIDFYTKKLHFTIIENEPDGEKRWVVLAPPGSRETRVVLGKASSEKQKLAIGNQTGGRVFLSLSTDDFWRDYKEMVSSGIKFIRGPKVERYGTVAVFEDLYGNLLDLIHYNR